MTTTQPTHVCVFAHSRKTNHVLHLLLSVLTAGLWAPVWAFVALNSKGSVKRCQICGRFP